MKPLDRARAMAAIGVVVLSMGLTDAMLKYVKASMRPWLVLAGVTLVVIGGCGMWLNRRTTPAPTLNTDHHGADHTGGHEHEHGEDHAASSRVGWLLVVPIIIVTLFGANSLGGFAPALRGAELPDYEFDLQAFADSTSERPVVVRIADIEQGHDRPANRRFLLANDVRFAGFVNHRNVRGPGSFVVTRYLISCCAADAIPLNVTIIGAPEVPDDNQWVDVTARLVDTPIPPTNTSDIPDVSMRAVRIRTISEPKGPYESLRG